ncbi:MAG: TCP-1/cpn60 chaperonin family protein, partial [Planctomycetota bacterium]
AVKAARKKADGDEAFGFDIVAEALRAPSWQIATNAGQDGDVTIEEVLTGQGGYGYNAGTGEFTDLVTNGIIDPSLVATTALLTAASVAGLMLTTDVLITELKDEATPVEGGIN